MKRHVIAASIAAPVVALGLGLAIALVPEDGSAAGSGQCTAADVQAGRDTHQRCAPVGGPNGPAAKYNREIGAE